MVRYKKGHKNSKGEKAEWCIVSHDTGRIISSHKSKSEAEKRLGEIQMFKHMKNESMSLDQAIRILTENHYVCKAAGHNGFELDYPSVDYYKEQIKIELKKLGYNSVDWVDREYWTKLINDLYSDERDVEDAAEILRDYENEEQMRASEE